MSRFRCERCFEGVPFYELRTLDGKDLCEICFIILLSAKGKNNEQEHNGPDARNADPVF